MLGIIINHFSGRTKGRGILSRGSGEKEGKDYDVILEQEASWMTSVTLNVRHIPFSPLLST